MRGSVTLFGLLLCGFLSLALGCGGEPSEPVRIAIPQGTGSNYGNGFLAVGVTHVYLSYQGSPHGGLVRAAKDGSDVLCIACDEGNPREIALDDHAVYWTDTELGELRTAPLVGGEVTTLWSGSIGSPIALTSFHVYWQDSSSGLVMRAELDGGNPVEATIVTGQTDSIAITWGYPCWPLANSIWCQEESDVGSQITDCDHPHRITAHDNRLYWVEGTSDQPDNAIVGGWGTPVTNPGDASVFDIAVDDTHVYAADNYGGTIWKVPTDGGDITVLATGQDFPFDIGVDDTAVYWTSETTAELFKVAK